MVVGGLQAGEPEALSAVDQLGLRPVRDRPWALALRPVRDRLGTSRAAGTAKRSSTWPRRVVGTGTSLAESGSAACLTGAEFHPQTELINQDEVEAISAVC